MAEPDLSKTPRAHTFRSALCSGLVDPLASVAFLESQGWKARPDTPPQPLPLTLDAWNADPLGDRNWRFQLHAWRPIDAYVTAHDVLGDDDYLERGLKVMHSWVEAEALADDVLLYWNDMGSGLRSAKLAYYLNRLPADHPEQPWLRALALRHLEMLLDPALYNLSNHSFFQIHGLLALLDAMPDAPDWAGSRRFAETMLDRILEVQMGQEGIHLEHSTGYHYFIIHTLKRMMVAGWYEDLPHLNEVIRRAQRALPWLTLPDGRMTAIGDTERFIPPLHKPPPTEGIRGKLFKEAGYAVVRSDWATPVDQSSMLLVTGSHHSGVHKHADELSFEWFEKGRLLIVDTGKYTYTHNEWRAFTNSARAHNSVVLSQSRSDNGLGLTEPAGGFLTGLKKTPRGWRVEGEIQRPAIGARHRRVFEYDPGRRLEIIDRIDLDLPGQVTAWLHLASDLVAKPRKAGWRFKGGRIRYAVEGAKRELIRVRGQMEPEIQGWCAEAYHQIQENDALGVRMTGKRIRLHTVITLDPPEGEAPEAD